MKHKIGKLMCSFLAIAFILQTMTGISILTENSTASAAEMGGTSSEVLDALRIQSTAVDIGSDGDNPYSENTNKVVNMFPRMELMMRNNVSNTGGITVYNQDSRVSGNFGAIASINALIWKHGEYTVTSEKPLIYSSSVGIDIDFDGRKNHVARVGTYMETGFGVGMFGFKRHRVLYIENDHGKVLTEVNLTEADVGDGSFYGYNLMSAIPIAAGDFDGDGRDEVAVTYTGYSSDKFDRTVHIYKATTNSLSLMQTIKQSDITAYPYTKNDPACLPQIHLAAGDLDDDNREELIITASTPHRVSGDTKIVVPRTTVWSIGKKEKSFSKKATFDHAWKYTEYDSADESGKTQFGSYGSAAVGDIDGDEKNELVMAANDMVSDKIEDVNRAINTNSAIISAAKYSSGKYEKYLGAVGHSVRIHSSIQQAIWSNDTQQPMPLACFNPEGTGGKDLIFVDGVVYELCVDSADARYDGSIPVSSGHAAARYGFKKILESDDIWPKDEKCYYGDKNSKSANIWIGSIAVGNFANDENGGEQLVFDHGRKRSGNNEYRHDIVYLHKGSSGNLISDNVCINNDRTTSYERNLDLAAIDNDNDGMRMKFKSKSAYFSEPNVVAVLQAAPYFADLEYMEPDYIEDGETVFGQTTGSGSSDTNGFSVTGSAITGFKQETSFLGIARLGGGEWEVEAHVSMGGEWEKSTDISYTTEYTSDSRDDRVILSMTPYVRYVYEMTIPEYKMPTYNEYTTQCGKLRGDNLEKYKQEVQLARNSGYGWGDTVPETKTDYIVCMPKTPRMSMIEVDEYDRIAEENGFEKVKGTVLDEIIGSPATYRSTDAGLRDFDGGKDVVGTETGIDSGNFIWVSKGGGSVTQSIETQTSHSSSITWGAGISTTMKSDIGGVIIGASIGADYEGSHTWSNYSGTSCSGTVAGIPRDAIGLGYDFKWRFGQWKDTLNGQDCIVMGYLVKDVAAPPNAPKNLTVKDTTETTATLNWTHPASVGTSYELCLVTENPSSPYYKLATLPATQTEYVVEGLSPDTSYNFVMRGVNSTKASAYTVPVTARTRYAAGANVPETQTLPDIHAVAGSNPSFTAEAAPAKGGTALTYQWQKLEADGSVSSWKDIDGKTDTEIKFYNVDKSMNGQQYRCMVAQFVNGNVAYVYTNAATLYVGAGSTETRLTLGRDFGTAAGEYKIPGVSTVKTQKPVYAALGSVKYRLYHDETDGYMLASEDTADKYILNADGAAKAESASDAVFDIDDADAVKLEEINEFADDEGNFTGISEGVTFTDETGSITAGSETIAYTKKYTDGEKTVYASEKTEDGETEYEYYYTASASAEAVKVSAKLVGYKTAGGTYKFKNAVPVTKEISESRTTYTAKTVAGTALPLTAEVESLSSGVVVTPKGSVEFVITNTANGSQFKKRVKLGSGSGNTNTASYSWTAEVSGTYSITARYIESVELMTSVSGEMTYIAYAINSNAGTSTEKSLVFGCGGDSISVGMPLDMQPLLREVEIKDDGSAVTSVTPKDTELSSDKITYSVSAKFGANADGKYSFDGNSFKAAEPGTYIITAEYRYTDEDSIEHMLSVSKTVNVKGADEKVQQQIYFAYSALVKNSTEKDILNPLTNPNAGSTVTFTSSDETVAKVNGEGLVTPVGAGTVTIRAVSHLAGTDDVSASYVLTIRKTPVTITAPDITVTYGASASDVLEKAAESEAAVSGGVKLSDITDEPLTYTTDYSYGRSVGNYTLTPAEVTSPKYEVNTESGKVTVVPKALSADDFTVRAADKSYDGTKDVILTAAVKPSSLITGDSVTADISGEFATADSGTEKTVNFEIKSLGGTNGSNYRLAGKLSGTVTAEISPMVIRFIAGAAVFAYDGEPKTLEPTAFDALGRVFDDFSVEYYDSEMNKLSSAPADAGEYTVKFVPNDALNFTAKGGSITMKIKQASQDRIEIIGLPGTVEYSDEFPLEAIGGSGSGVFEWKSDNENITVTADENDSSKAEVKINGAVGEKVTITAVKTDDGNYSKSETKIAFVPSGKTLGFVISDLLKEYDGSAQQPTVETVPAGGDYTVKYNGSDEIPANAGTYTVTVSGSGNYRGSGSATMIIKKGSLENKNLSVSLDNWVYKAETLPEPKVSSAPDGTDVEISYSTPGGERPVNAGTYTVYASYSGENYETFTAKHEFTVEKRKLTVTANNTARKYGEQNPKFSVSYSGFASGEDESVLDTPPVCETAATAGSPVKDGGYEITVSGARAANYDVEKISGTLTIEPASGENFYIDGANNTASVGDVFTLRPHCDGFVPSVTWESSNPEIAAVDGFGKVTALSEGTVVIKARLADKNYIAAEADFNLAVSKKEVTLTPDRLVLTYSGSVQKIGFTSNTASFVPVTEGDGKNVDVSYTLNTDSSVTEPKTAGTYTVVYKILGNSYTGSGTAQLTINKYKAEIKADDCEKTYGDENPKYTFSALIGDDAADADYIARVNAMFSLSSPADADGASAKAGEYPITVSLADGASLNGDANYDFTISPTTGKLTVNKKALSVKVSGAKREYGAKTFDTEYSYDGFANGETEDNLDEKPQFEAASSITETTPVGKYEGIITGSAISDGNYAVSYVYENGVAAPLTIEKRVIEVSSASFKNNELIVKFSKAALNLTKDNFAVKCGEKTVETESASPAGSNLAYAIKGAFSTGNTYSVSVTLDNNYTLSGSPIEVTYKAPYSGGSTGGGGGGGGGSAEPEKFTVSFETNGGSSIPSEKTVSGKTVKKPSDPEKDGFSFDGWYTDRELTEKFDFETEITENITLYAKWVKADDNTGDGDTKTDEPEEIKNPFRDVKDDDWFKDAVLYNVKEGLFSGKTKDTFAPNDIITRGMIATVLYRLEGEPETDEICTFTDIIPGEYYEKAVAWAQKNGIVMGYSDEIFMPDRFISREEMAAIMHRYADFKKIDKKFSGSVSDFTDADEISDWAKDDVLWAVGCKIISGRSDSTLEPGGTATRAETASIIQRFTELYK